MDPYATHLPHLIRAVLMTGGPVLELGMGDYSTPVLLELCCKARPCVRRLLSFENDPAWFEKFKTTDVFWVPLLVKPDWSDFRVIGQFSVIFIDLHPAELRPTVLEAVRDRGDIIVAHDSESLAFDWTRFKHHREFTSPEGPRTMLASNIIDVTT